MNPNLIYRPDIDGLRAVAVLAVVLNHLSPTLVPGGYVGVDVFFVISGYLITNIINCEIQLGHFSFAHFYERRARRIFPALFVVLSVTLVIGYFLMLPTDYLSTLRGALGTLFFSSNIVFWRDMSAGYFAATEDGLNPLLHTWSLAVEEQFYLIFPFLLLICSHYIRRHIIFLFAGCAIVSLAGAALLLQSKSVAVFFLSPFRAWELLVGSLLAFNAFPKIQTSVIREAVAGSGLLLILAACFLYNSKTSFPGISALAPVLGATAIIYAGLSGPSFSSRLLQLKPIVYIGLISYSLYLWHWPLMVLVRYAIGMEPTKHYILVLFVISLALGSMSYHFIEQPFRQRSRFTSKNFFSSSAAFVSVLAIASIIGLFRGGFESRFNPEVVKLDKERSPQIPFVDCDNKRVGTGCILGRAESKPTYLVWGDSHSIAWAPVLDVVLASKGEKAVLVTTAGCPPILEVNKNMVNEICPLQNIAVKNYLVAHPEINTVVMSAYWSAYFREDGPLTLQAGNTQSKGIDAVKTALISTLQWLRENERQVVLIGPVPIYEMSVPMVLALEKTTSRVLLRSTMNEQRKKNNSFFEAVDQSNQDGGRFFRFIDPIKWMCTEDCKVIKNGTSLYRDSHHLSVAGAMNLETELFNELFTVLSK